MLQVDFWSKCFHWPFAATLQNLPKLESLNCKMCWWTGEPVSFTQRTFRIQRSTGLPCRNLQEMRNGKCSITCQVRLSEVCRQSCDSDLDLTRYCHLVIIFVEFFLWGKNVTPSGSVGITCIHVASRYPWTVHCTPCLTTQTCELPIEFACFILKPTESEGPRFHLPHFPVFHVIDGRVKTKKFLNSELLNVWVNSDLLWSWILERWIGPK